MYHDIKDVYWWNGMKKNIAEFVAQCSSYQQVKVENQKPGGLIQTVEIPTWKWEAINMDFVTGLPRSHCKFDSIWVSPKKGMMRFDKKVKLSPRYIGPYKIIQKVGQVACELELPSELEYVHLVFHVSKLRKCIGDPTRVVSMDDVQIMEDLSYEEIPVAILDRQICKLRNKEVASVKVLWKSKNVEEMTWEAEKEKKSKYPHLFPTEDIARDGMLQYSSIQASRSSG
ncbi:uncharacterized protein [Nicotiana tomentosiformis]|uniref:uncharacterized protein n=1 Tax=Nicotiana tomentosiformis TaxID=4098 RepID=UPI00388CE92E